MFNSMAHFGENKLWQQQNCFFSLTRIDFAVLVSSRAVRISTRAVRVFPALSLRRVQPSYGTFTLMVFQGNCARGRTGRMINMLLAGWEVRIGKNCDRGLENAARGRRPRAAFSIPRSQFFPIRTDPKAANNIFLFFSTRAR